MRIALVAEHASPLAVLGKTEVSGRHTYIAGLARALADRGHDVVVYTRRDAWQLPARCELFPGVQVSHITAGPTRPATEDERSRHVPAFGRQLIRTWTSHGRPDIVHAHGWRSGSAAMVAGRATGVPVVQTFHELSDRSDGSDGRDGRDGSDGNGEGSPPEQAPTESDLISEVEHIVATRSSVAAEFARLGVRPHRVSTVAGGVDTDLFSPHGVSWEAGAGPRLACLGELVERKRLDMVLTATARLPDAELLIAGGPPSSGIAMSNQARQLREQADELGLRGRLRLTGTLKHEAVPELLRSSDVVVSTPDRAPYGLTPFEAMSCGRPVVCTAVDGPAEAVHNSSTGLFVASNDPDELVAAIRRLLDDKALSERLGEQGRRRAVAHYDWKQVAERVEAAYGAVVDARSAAATAG